MVRHCRRYDIATRLKVERRWVRAVERAHRRCESTLRIVIDCERETGEKTEPRSPAPLTSAASKKPNEKTPDLISPAPVSLAPAAPAVNKGGTFSVARQLGLGLMDDVLDGGADGAQVTTIDVGVNIHNGLHVVVVDDLRGDAT